MDVHYKETTYGFEYGSATISRITSDEKKGWVVLGIKTPKYDTGELQIYITKTGKVRIFDPNGEWKKPGDKRQCNK
jgi:hypothetical protein